MKDDSNKKCIVQGVPEVVCCSDYLIIFHGLRRRRHSESLVPRRFSAPESMHNTFSFSRLHRHAASPLPYTCGLQVDNNRVIKVA